MKQTCLTNSIALLCLPNNEHFMAGRRVVMVELCANINLIAAARNIDNNKI